MLHMKVVKGVNPKSSHHRGKYFFYLFNFVSVWDDECSLNLCDSHFMMYVVNQSSCCVP